MIPPEIATYSNYNKPRRPGDRSSWSATRGRKKSPIEICSDRPGECHVSQFARTNELRGDDLAVVELQPGQSIEPEFKKMHFVFSPVPGAAGAAHGKQLARREADFFGQLSARRCFGRFTSLDAAARKCPCKSVRRPNQQQRVINIDRNQRPLMPLTPHLPPDASEWETNSEGHLPSGVQKRARPGSPEI
jgi:hypothetical protein